MVCCRVALLVHVFCFLFQSTEVGYHGDILGITLRTVSVCFGKNALRGATKARRHLFEKPFKFGDGPQMFCSFSNVDKINC